MLAALVAAGPAAAQQDTARRDTTRILLEPITVTATRAPAPRTKIGTALDVVTADDLRREPPAWAVDAVARRPGISLDEAAGPGGPTIIRIRGGEEVFSQILMDGVQVNQNGGFFDFQGLPLANVERNEIARGPQSALYGSTAVNGVVQFITRSGHVGRPRLGVELAGGDASENGGAARGAATVRGGNRLVRYSAGAGTAYDRGIFAVAHDIRAHEASLRVDAAPPGLGVAAVARYTSLDAHLPVRDPGATRVPLDPNARNSRDRFVGSLHATVGRGALRHRAGGSVYREMFVFEDIADGVSDPNFFVFDANFRLDSRLVRTTLDYVATLETLAGRAPLSLAAGAQWERESLHDRTGGDFGSDTLDLVRDGAAVFAEARATLAGRLHALAGVRAEQVEDLEAEVSPRASFVLDLSDALALRGAIGRAFKAPNLQQQYLDNPFIISNPDLQPETSWSWELGLRVRPSPVMSVEAGVFRQDYDNLIRTVQSTTDSTRQINRNIGAARAWGLELEGAWAPPSGTRVEAGAAWVTTTVLENAGLNPAEYPVDRPLPFRPAVTASALVAAPVGRRLEVAVRGTVVGQQVVLTERFSGRRERLGAYGLLGATATVHLARDLAGFARVDNLLDHAYDTGFDRRGRPRTWTLGVRWGE